MKTSLKEEPAFRSFTTGVQLAEQLTLICCRIVFFRIPTIPPKRISGSEPSEVSRQLRIWTPAARSCDCLHACIHTHIHACIHTYIHTYVHTHTTGVRHAHMHTHRLACMHTDRDKQTGSYGMTRPLGYIAVHSGTLRSAGMHYSHYNYSTATLPKFKFHYRTLHCTVCACMVLLYRSDTWTLRHEGPQGCREEGCSRGKRQSRMNIAPRSPPPTPARAPMTYNFSS